MMQAKLNEKKQKTWFRFSQKVITNSDSVFFFPQSNILSYVAPFQFFATKLGAKTDNTCDCDKFDWPT